MSDIIRLMVGPGQADNVTFGKLIASLRDASGFTRAQFSNKLNLSSEYIRLMERGLRVPAAGTFHISLEKLGINHTLALVNDKRVVTFRNYEITFTSRIQKARELGNKQVNPRGRDISTTVAPDGRSRIRLYESALVVFIPKDDDTFATTSHYCMAVVETPEGVWLFNKQLQESHGN